ncbi:MAG: hypothetical protein FMNOHCHN_02446 [Ignavibacteriaceae bacterium]|nr:hypothetical protein [Ignavibacteriaceae bacterium]
MNDMLLAPAAVLFVLYALGMRSFVLCRGIIPSFALGAF